jgi:hypothetical protein
MRLTIEYIENMIKEAKKVGADPEKLADLEKFISRQSLESLNVMDEDYIFEEELDSEGSKVTFYSNAPISHKDRTYFEKIRSAKSAKNSR